MSSRRVLLSAAAPGLARAPRRAAARRRAIARYTIKRRRCPGKPSADQAEAAKTATPIKHLVAIFEKNVSFARYFATCPKAANPPEEPEFTAAPNRRRSQTG